VALLSDFGIIAFFATVPATSEPRTLDLDHPFA
jgi:hypothetical protein